jgi:hypothetical protein
MFNAERHTRVRGDGEKNNEAELEPMQRPRTRDSSEGFTAVK